ncbi:MAG: extracellular solute-binding protein [Bacilli bacterium]|jgi:putative aldouronate transport system substrate-binding protein
MKRKSSLSLGLLVTGLMLTALPSCTGGGKKIVYPDFPNTPTDKDSWEYLLDENGVPKEQITIDWYVNDSTFSWPGYGSDVISQKIQEKTGVTIRFNTPVTDDGQKLATMISGDVLPDVVSIQSWYQQCSQLALQNYLFPVDELMRRWAPNFLDRVEEDLWNYFQEGNGHNYGFPNICFSENYLSGEQLYPNGGMLVREDWYNQALAAGYDMTTPESFINGCKYIQGQYSNAIPFQLDPFTNEGNKSITWLAQYFATPFETSEGVYQDIRTDVHYQQMLRFLNECNREGIIKPSNYSDTYAQIKTNISRGNVFACIATPQDYQVAYQNCFNNGINYIPLVLRNYDGDAPVLQDISGQGYLFSMISTNCKRPDIVIKLLDFLHSEEGQRLVAFGVEGETWEWTDETKTKIKWTERYISGALNQNPEDAAWLAQYGINAMTLMMNMSFIFKYRPMEGRKAETIYIDNQKRPLTPYSYDFRASFLKHDTAHKDYFTISTKAKKIDTKWTQALVNIIQASDYLAAYNNAISFAKKQGLDEVVEFYKTSYANTLSVLGLTRGYPAYKEGYIPPVTGPNGDFSYWIGATHE